MNALILVPVAGLAWTLWMVRRINAVGDYRIRLIDAISAASKADFANGLFDYDWRYEAFNAVSFERMAYCFWRPLDSFYPDKSFTQPRRAA